MEDKLTDLKLSMQEIESSLIILQKALNNNEENITITNIDNCLEVIIEKTKNTIKLL